ncbi:MAG: ABC transporter permease [Sphingobacteriaceae bacterium]
MFKHYLLITIRNLNRFKGSFLINLIGLSTGLACTLFIYLWVNDEVQLDKFHEKDSQLFQIMELSKENNELVVHDGTQGILAAAMVKDLPEVEAAVPVMSLEKEGMMVSLSTPEKSLKSYGIFAGSDFFNMFSFKLIEGKAALVMKDKNAIVISENIAKGLFGSASNALGKSIEFEVLGKKKQSLISGIFENVPPNSSLKFDFVLTHDLLINDIWTNGQKWWNTGPATYLQLKKGTDVAQFNNKIKNFIKPYDKGTIYTLFTRPYSSAYLYGKYENGVQAGGRYEYVKLFFMIAVFILLIACINFMNLSTAKASRRIKEVGIKKAVGSTRRSLILQFLSEAIFMAFLSLLIAVMLVAMLLPFFNQVTGKQLSMTPDLHLILVVIGVTFLTGIISGSYPAFYLSGFNPVAILKGRPQNAVSELLARKGLVVFQFLVSLVLIVSVMVIYKQMEYVQSKNLGYDKSNIIYFDKEGAVTKNSESFIAALKKLPDIINASAIQQNVVQSGLGNGSSTYGISWPGKPNGTLIDFVVRAVDYDMIETLGIKFKEGRSFSKTFGSDSIGLIFNEAAIKVMGLKKPIGTPIKMWDQNMSIIGVVKDFHMTSLHQAIAPMVFMYQPRNTSMIMAKLAPGREKETIARVESFYKKFNPGYVFEYKFLDDTYQTQYIAEQRVSILSRYFAGLAILISCLGLFGLAAFNAEVRTKEIGIRKVLGASVSNLMFLLSKDFFKLVILAVVIAFPLSWWAMKSWLSGFVYKIDIGVNVFLTAFAAIVLITILTVSFHAIKAAITNPVKSLRSE